MEVQGDKVVIDGRVGPSGVNTNLRASRVVPTGARRVAGIAPVISSRGRSYNRPMSRSRIPTSTVTAGTRVIPRGKVAVGTRPANIPIVSKSRTGLATSKIGLGASRVGLGASRIGGVGVSRIGGVGASRIGGTTTTTTGLRQSRYIPKTGNRVVGGGLRSSSYYPRSSSSRVVQGNLRKSAFNPRSTSSRVIGGLRKSGYNSIVPTTSGGINVTGLRKSGYARNASSKWDMRKSNYSSRSNAAALRKSYTTASIRGDASMRRSNYVNNAFDDQLRKSGISRSRVVSNYDVDRAVDRIINRTLYN